MTDEYDEYDELIERLHRLREDFLRLNGDTDAQTIEDLAQAMNRWIRLIEEGRRRQGGSESR